MLVLPTGLCRHIIYLLRARGAVFTIAQASTAVKRRYSMMNGRFTVTRFVEFPAPRSVMDFLAKFICVELVVVVFALTVVMVLHGDFPYGLGQQIADTALIGVPFVMLGLFIMSPSIQIARAADRDGHDRHLDGIV
jgi:hypothetical protein